VASPAGTLRCARLVRQPSRRPPRAVQVLFRTISSMLNVFMVLVAAVAARRGPVLVWGRRGEISLNWRNPLAWPLGLLYFVLMPFLALGWLILHLARWWR
jgi:hypothetical protein